MKRNYHFPGFNHGKWFFLCADMHNSSVVKEHYSLAVGTISERQGYHGKWNLKGVGRKISN